MQNFKNPYNSCDENCKDLNGACIHAAYRQGYEDSTKYWTNDCFFCGPMGDWSTTACSQCLSKEENQWFKE